MTPITSVSGIFTTFRAHFGSLVRFCLGERKPYPTDLYRLLDLDSPRSRTGATIWH